MEKRELYRIVSDIFTVPGLFCMFYWGLRWVAGQGAFHGVSYVLKNALRLLTFRQTKPYQPKEIKKNGSAVLLLCGVVFLTAAGIFAGLYYK